MPKSFGPKIFKSVHVKGGTLGTSNEISFSVLDAKKQQDDQKSSTKKKPFVGPVSLGKVALFSLPGKKNVVSTPKHEKGLTLSTGEFVSGTPDAQVKPAVLGGVEVESSDSVTQSPSKSLSDKTGSDKPKEANPKRTRRIVAIVALICIVAGLAFGVYSGVNYFYSAYLNNLSYAEFLDSSLASVSTADEVISLMDESLDNLLSEESLTAIKQAQTQLDTATDALDRAERLALRAQSGMTDTADLTAAKQALETIAARRTMLSSGAAIMEKTVQANAAIGALDAAWADLLEADNVARTAAEKLSGITEFSTSGLETTIAQIDDATALFSQVGIEFSEIPELYDVDVTPYTDYIQVRLDALGHFKNACNAALSEDTATAHGEIALYNGTEGQASIAAASLDSDFGPLVKQIFSDDIAQDTVTYQTAAKIAETDDSALRKYLANNK